MHSIVAEDGCRIAYDVTGEGPALLLIPGLGGSAEFWAPVVPLLAPNYKVIAVDHRGAGRSDRPIGRYAIEQIAADTARILDALKIASADVVGHSTGGIVAQTLALDHADRVGRLVLSGSWARFDERMAELFRARAEVLEQAGGAVYQRLTHALGYPAEWIAGHRDELDAAIAAAETTLAPIAVTLERIRMLGRTDRSTDLPQIAAPTLVIGAEDDPMIPFYQSERLVQAIPGARLAALPGSHFYPRVHPERFVTLVTGFLEQPHVPR